MLQGLIACLSVVSTVLLAFVIMFLYKFKRSIPDIQQILDDVGSSIGEQLTGIFEKPIVKASMTQLGKKSGEFRADKALKTRVAEKALGQSIIVKKALEYFGLSPLEGIELMRDPTFGPIIQGFIAKGGQGLLGDLGGGNSPGRVPQRGNVPLMS